MCGGGGGGVVSFLLTIASALTLFTVLCTACMCACLLRGLCTSRAAVFYVRMHVSCVCGVWSVLALADDVGAPREPGDNTHTQSCTALARCVGDARNVNDDDDVRRL